MYEVKPYTRLASGTIGGTNIIRGDSLAVQGCQLGVWAIDEEAPLPNPDFWEGPGYSDRLIASYWI